MPLPDIEKSVRTAPVRWTRVAVWSNCTWNSVSTPTTTQTSIYLLELTDEGIAYGQQLAAMADREATASLERAINHPRFETRALIMDRANRDRLAPYDRSLRHGRETLVVLEDPNRTISETWQILLPMDYAQHLGEGCDELNERAPDRQRRFF